LRREWLARFPQSYFLREQFAAPDLNHLADDADRVLNVAALYMRLGMYQPALEALSRTYPAAVPDETEPGSLPPQHHPLVAYFRAYCMEKLGQPASAAYQAASKLSTAYVFPSSAQELDVLQAALRQNTEDGTARYLLGTLYFSRGLTDEALTEWNAAQVGSRPAGPACQPGAGPVAGKERSGRGVGRISRGAAQRSQQR
jgi:tetratricopeptide (TPR) repeat protein